MIWLLWKIILSSYQIRQRAPSYSNSSRTCSKSNCSSSKFQSLPTRNKSRLMIQWHSSSNISNRTRSQDYSCPLWQRQLQINWCCHRGCSNKNPRHPLSQSNNPIPTRRVASSHARRERKRRSSDSRPACLSYCELKANLGQYLRRKKLPACHWLQGIDDAKSFG